ncbi:MAG: hypothetical protein QM734_14335 [Cyclobacteriaceae bacterium]
MNISLHSLLVDKSFKWFLFLLIVLPQVSFSQSPELYKEMAKQTCDCINKQNITGKSKKEIETALGLCMLEVIQNNKVDIDISNTDAMRELGQKVGVQMAPICPAVFKAFLDDENSGDNSEKVIALEGKVKFIEENNFLYLIVKDESGTEYRLILLSYFEGSDTFASDPGKLSGKNVSIKYRTTQYYSPKAKGFMSVKEIVELKIKE